MQNSKIKITKTSILSSQVLNYVKNYVSEQLSAAVTDQPTSSTSLKDDEVISKTQDQSNKHVKKSQHESLIATCNEQESIAHSNSMQIDEIELKNNNNQTKNANKNEYSEKTTPQLLFKAETEFQVPSKSKKENFLKGCKWSPDGTCVLTNSNDFTLRIFDVTENLINNQIDKTTVDEIKSSLKLKEAGGIYDYAWYPLMNSYNPDTACVFSTSKDNPIHLFDAYTGGVRCSYQGYNHLDELVCAYSIAFNSTTTKLYCGYNKCIKVFDINRPGKNYENIFTANYDYKLPGMVSCISFSSIGCYAAGSYTKYIGIYIESNNGLLCMLQGHAGGLTHLMFSSDGNYLFSGGRKDPDIFCWDMRNPGKILQVYKRDVTTNQRIYFDLDKNWRYMCSGNNDGEVKFWHANNYDSKSEYENTLFTFKAHNDCVNGVSFHPTLPVLATTSGQRKLIQDEIHCSDDSLSSSSDSDNESSKSLKIRENSLKIWNLNNKN